MPPGTSLTRPARMPGKPAGRRRMPLPCRPKVTRLEKLLSDPGSGGDKRSTITKLRMEVARLHRGLEDFGGPQHDDARELTRGERPAAKVPAANGRPDRHGPSRCAARSPNCARRPRHTAGWPPHSARRRGAAQKSLSGKTDRLLEARERSKEHRDTIQSLGSKVRDLERLLARQAP